LPLKERDRGKVLHSIARWLAGLKPEFGDRHYFERFSVSRCVMTKLERYRGSGVCPFCGKKFKRLTSMVVHVVKAHGYELEDLLERCREEVGRR